jgi:hypothetical protein
VPGQCDLKTVLSHVRWIGGAPDAGKPETALQNHIARDELYARRVKEQALERGLALLEVDGSLTIDELVALVARHFGLATVTSP